MQHYPFRKRTIRFEFAAFPCHYPSVNNTCERNCERDQIALQDLRKSQGTVVLRIERKVKY